MKLSEAVSEVIDLSEAIRNYWAAELPKRHRDYPIVHPGEDSGPPPPEEKKLRALLSQLSEDAIYKLAILAYLGRGDFDANDLEEKYKTRKETFGKPEDAISQMMEKAPLADYLIDGLEELKRHQIDVDNLLGNAATSGA